MYLVGSLSLVALLLGQKTSALDLSSCCAVLNIESTGEASEHQSNRLGQYRLGGLFSDRPIYKHEERDEFLFYLTSRNRGLWMVGPSVGQFNGGLANRGDPVCAEDTPNGQWKYTDGQSWNRDTDLRITCVEQELPECSYNDQTDFEGGDLPEALGGGGLVTSATTSAECITECETRKACRYWTWTGEPGANCYLKNDRLSQVRRPKHVSGSVSSACAQPKPEKAEPKFNEQEINGKFKITSLKWDDKLSDPSSIEYKELSNSIEDSLVSMLENEGDLSEQVESFTVEVQRFTRGSVVCDFKVNYVLKEAYVAIPFAIKPSNITDAMGKNFKFKKGILFQRFLIAADSFKASAPVDHCAAKGCSHKCNYDYSLEDYVCTCPPTLVLDIGQRNCLSLEEAEAEKATSAAPETTSAAVDEVTTPETLVEEVEQEQEDEEVTTKASEDVEEEEEDVEEVAQSDDDAGKVETTTVVTREDDADEEVGTTVKAATDYEDFGADEEEDEVVDGSSTESPKDESTEAAEEEIVPQFGDKETTVSPVADETSGDSEGGDVDKTDEEATTEEEEIRPIESSTPADDDTSEQDEEDEEDEEDEVDEEEDMNVEEVTVDASGEDEGTTSFPDIMKILPEVIDEAINDLFDGATTESSETEDEDEEDIIADPVVITVDADTTTEAADVVFSTVGPIEPLEDPSLSDEDSEATTVSIQEFTEESAVDPESRDQEAAATDAPLVDLEGTRSEEAGPEKMPRLDDSNEQPEMTTMASEGETEDKATTTQASSETKAAPVEGDDVVTELDGGLVTVTPGAVSEETPVSPEDVDVAADEVTTVAPITTTILSIEETDEGVTIVTTMMPMESMTTTARSEDDKEDTTRAEDEAATTVRAESDSTTTAIDVDGETVEDPTTPKTEVTTVTTDSESDTITIMVGPETDSETTTAKSDLESSTTVKSEIEEATDLPEDAGVEVDSEEEEGETTTAKVDAEIEEEDENDMTDDAEGTTPKTDVEEDALEDGEGRSMLEVTTTLQPGDGDVTTPKTESETTVPSVSQESSTEIPESEVTAVPMDADEDAEMTTLSQSPPSLGPTSEDTESSGEPELEVTSSPVDEDTPSVPEEGVTTTIMPDAVVTLLTTVRPRAQDEDQTEQAEDVEDDTIDAAEEEKPEGEGTTLAPEDAGMHEFDCSEFTDAELAFADPNQIPLQCRLRPKEGGEPKTVYILIPKQGLDLTRLFDKNVKVVVKDLMIMDISPK